MRFQLQIPLQTIQLKIKLQVNAKREYKKKKSFSVQDAATDCPAEVVYFDMQSNTVEVQTMHSNTVEVQTMPFPIKKRLPTTT
jgi:hypothetical protein